MADQVKISDEALGEVAGGADYEYATGSYVNYGSYIVYTIASGDVLGGIANRFGVTVDQIAEWNKIQNKDLIYAGQKLTIYAAIIR